MENRKSRINTACTILSGDDRIDRACKSIPDSSCTNLQSSFQNPYVYGSIFILLGSAQAGVLLYFSRSANKIPSDNDVINIHAGGACGNKEEAFARWKSAISP